jgi:hypothetical protein
MTMQKARSQSENNVCLGSGCTEGKPHGVAFQSDRYVMFQGLTYASRDTAQDEFVEANPGITRTSAFTEVVFSQLTGDANTSGTIMLADGVRSAQISINYAGRISW